MFESTELVDNLCTKGYHLIDNFLEESIYQELCSLAYRLTEDNAFQPAKIGQNTHTQQNQAIRKDKIYWLDALQSNPSISCYLKEINTLIALLNQTLFLSLHDHELHFAVYHPGSFYKKHTDQFRTTKTRKISCVYYLNKTWEPSYGGALNLYSKKEELLKTILPVGNRFICFNSELPHEVEQTERVRYSITGWLKTRALETTF